MSKAIQGVHHIALKPVPEQYKKTVEFYTEILGMDIVRSWGEGDYPCLMISCGDNTCMEILCGTEPTQRGGALVHIAFATNQVDVLVEKVRAAGYEITKEPSDLVLGNGGEVRVAFCYGPVGEHVEFFWEK